MKKGLCAALALVLCLGLLACQSSGGDKPQYGLVLQPEGNAYQEKLREGFVSGIEALGGGVITCYPEDSSAQAQVALVEDLIEQGVRGIAISGSEVTGLEDVLEDARDAGISVISLDRDTEGSQLFVHQAEPGAVAQALMDAVFDIAGGEGEFAVLSTNMFSGSDAWVSAMKHIWNTDAKYANLVWVDTRYCSGERAAEKVEELLDAHPGLKVICSPSSEGIISACQVVQARSSSVKVTGLNTPSGMQSFVGDDKPCPYYFLWNPVELGNCAAYALEALCAGAVLEEGGTLTTGLGTYEIFNGDPARFLIHMGPPFKFDSGNTAQWAEVY